MSAGAANRRDSPLGSQDAYDHSDHHHPGRPDLEYLQTVRRTARRCCSTSEHPSAAADFRRHHRAGRPNSGLRTDQLLPARLRRVHRAARPHGWPTRSPTSTAVLDAARRRASSCTLGWSGGGPHALACAALLPERCQAAAVLAGVAPYPARTASTSWPAWTRPTSRSSAPRSPGRGELERAAEPLLGRVRPQVTGASVVEALAGLLPPVDQAALTGEFAEEMAAGVPPGGEATASPAGATTTWPSCADWGFALRRDHACRSRSGRAGRTGWCRSRTASGWRPRSRRAEPHLFADEGHLSLVSQAGEILADLLDWPTAASRPAAG